ncbi:hypothetical protein GM3708_318 [Geminocystis sp. NIES-3708]|nr:hypothetical protein GM3708_318 [Geminocystis sp. NIES-3708]
MVNVVHPSHLPFPKKRFLEVTQNNLSGETKLMINFMIFKSMIE